MQQNNKPYYFKLTQNLPVQLPIIHTYNTHLMAMGTESLKNDDPIVVIPTRPPDNAPREAPSRLLGSYRCKTFT